MLALARVFVPVPALISVPEPLRTPPIVVDPEPARVRLYPPFVTLATTEKRLEELFVHPWLAVNVSARLLLALPIVTEPAPDATVNPPTPLEML